MHFVTYHILALGLYTGLTTFFFYRLRQHQVVNNRLFLGLIALAIGIQATGIYHGIVQPNGIDLSLHHMISLVGLSVNAVVVISCWRKPLHSLFILLLPLSMIVLGSVLLIESSGSPTSNASYQQLSVGIGIHILLSIVAYSLLFAAVLQALLVSWQDHHLKSRQMTGITRHLAPLQTMESLLFELVWVGVGLLTVALLSGVYYVDNIFDQHLTHKTLLSFVAWAVFALLLYGRVTRGWRGNYATRWILGGFCVLMLAYFGSKLVLEVILV